MGPGAEDEPRLDAEDGLRGEPRHGLEPDTAAEPRLEDGLEASPPSEPRLKEEEEPRPKQKMMRVGEQGGARGGEAMENLKCWTAAGSKGVGKNEKGKPKKKTKIERDREDNRQRQAMNRWISQRGVQVDQVNTAQDGG